MSLPWVRLAAVLLLIVALGGSATAFAAQIPFGPQQIVSTSEGIGLEVIAGDLDGDGDLDLVSMGGSNAGSGVYWYENLDGAGTYSSARAIGAGQLENRGSIELVDMDQDGDLDLLSGWFFLAAWYPNDGQGNFGARTIIRDETSVGAGYQGFKAADLDGDGDPDVIGLSGIAFGPGDKLVWFRNNGGGSFNPATENFIDSLANENGVGNAQPADMDGDGDNDIVTIQSASFGGDNRVVWYRNTDGAGNFSAKLTISSATQQPFEIAVADMDGDGDLDVVSVDYGFNAARWHENTAGDGSAWTDRTITTSGSISYFVEVSDLDQDGDTDVLLSDRTTGEVRWVENTAGNGSAWTNRLIQGGFSTPSGAVAADLDGDGDPDVATASISDNKIAWNENRTIHRNAVFGSPLAVDAAVNDARGVVAADLDRDGDLDAVVGARLDQQIAWFDNNGGPPSGWTKRTISTPGSFPEDVAVADLDGDGDLDIASSPRNNAVDWLENDGAVPPGFTVRTITGTLGVGSGNDSAAGDIDGDGDVDLIALAGKLGWYENNGASPPGWTERVIEGFVDNARTVELADIDGDGDLDALAGILFGTTVAWYENDGATPPAWTKRSIDSPGPILWTVAVDVDRDGDLDVTAASLDDDKLYWYENNGAAPPVWTRHDVAVTVDVRSAAAVDFDFDGDIDFVSAPAAAGILWHENNGGSPPQWTTSAAFFSAFRSFLGFDAADLDGDGDLDLLAAAAFEDTLYALDNIGGQYRFSGADISTGSAYDGEVAPVLAVGVRVNGRPGDSVGRLATLAIRLESGPTALSSAQANALFDELRVYRDDGNGAFDASLDILVATVGTLSLSGGVQTVTLPSSDPNVRVAAPATFFVVPLMAPNASAQAVSAFFATHLALAGSTVVDGNAGITLAGAATSNVATAGVQQARPRFVVNSTADGVDAVPGNGLCATGGGACTLRAAIQEANARVGVDRIVLPAGTFTLTIPGTGEDAAATGDLDITDTSRLTLVGAGAETTILSGGGIDRVLHLRPSAALTLEDVTVTGGSVSGAGVRGAGLLTETSNSLTIRRCAFRGNASLGSGGAALATGGSNVVTVESSVFHGNSSFDGGAAIHSGSAMNILSCTISGNSGTSATSVAVESFGALNVNNSTITANQGGLLAASSTITLAGSLVAGNPSAGLTGDDVNTGTFTSGGYNFIGESASGAFVHGVNGDQVGIIGTPLVAGLQPLGDYGGPTLTHAPLSGSPVVDKGRCVGVTVDQRGVPRPIDVAGVANASDGCDAGAYELESGATLSRLEVPMRWCGLRGSPSIENPSLMGASNVNDLLRRRHEAASDSIYAPQGGIVFRSAANLIVEDYPLLEDPDCTEVTPGNFTCARGQRGDVYIEPEAANFDEYEELIAACRAAWHAQDPTIEGVTAVQIRQFVDDAGAPLSILGIGGRAREGNAREQAAAGRVAVVDHFYRQSVPGNPSPPNPSDTIDRLLSHELGHALSLRHGDGIDNDGNGSIDDNDEAAVGLPRFDGNNIMQYRSGSVLSSGQATQARNHMLSTLPDVRVQPLADAAPNGAPLDERNVSILDFGFDGVLDLANVRILDFRNVSILDFEQDGVLDFANVRILDFKNVSILDFRNVSILDFGMSYNGETPAGSTSLHATTAAIPWPPALRPKTRYYFYLDVDRDDATGAYPASKVNPSDAPNRFPGSNNFVSSPTVAEESGVDLIAQVDLESTCTGNQCSSSSQLRIFDYNDGTGAYVQVSSSPSPSISTVNVGLYVDNGGAAVDLDSAPSGITIQPVIPNSVLFAAGWGFTTPPGASAPVPNPVRMEVVSTIDCVGNILNDGSGPVPRNCQCTSCAACPDYPGCVGTSGVPLTLAGTTILTDGKAGELTFKPPILPACTVIPALAAQGQAVTVYVTQLPTNLTGTVEVTQAASVIGTTPTASISAAGSVSVTATLPATALGQVNLSAGITGYAPRAQCLVTVTPSVACTDTDADGSCDSVDADDDNDGIADGGDAAALNRLVCRDVDADQCDDCSGGTDAPLVDGPDYDYDGLCDRGDPDDDNDGVLDGADGQPRNANACGDSDGDTCDDCVIASTPSPGNDGPDVDLDGQCDFGDPDDDNDGVSDWVDCAPLDGTLRSAPAAVVGARMGSVGNKNRLSWTAPQAQGGSATVSDVLRGNNSGLPVGSGAENCLATGTAAAQLDDATSPGSGSWLWYLIRARNACGTGSYGTTSAGASRTSNVCP